MRESCEHTYPPGSSPTDRGLPVFLADRQVSSRTMRRRISVAGGFVGGGSNSPRRKSKAPLTCAHDYEGLMRYRTTTARERLILLAALTMEHAA